MKVQGRAYRTIRRHDDGHRVCVIDQTQLPHRFVTRELASLDEVAHAIKTMIVRGAPLIGATAAYGVAIAMAGDASDGNLASACEQLIATRPTAVNLRWAVGELRARLASLPASERRDAAYARADELCEEDVELCRRIGLHGLEEIKRLAGTKAVTPIQVLTHCNAGWLATVDWGTALAPIYHAHDAGLDIHVWVDETRPRNQGASLTAWELASHGVPHTVIVDNAGGHLMQRGLVDLCIVGSDRTTRRGDVCNKIGTYLKALAARDNGVPFYVAVPYPSIDWALGDGMAIPIEERPASEVSRMTGTTEAGELVSVDIVAPGSPAANPAFDVTPARLVTALITERGVCAASEAGLVELYPEREIPA